MLVGKATDSDGDLMKLYLTYNNSRGADMSAHSVLAAENLQSCVDYEPRANVSGF